MGKKGERKHLKTNPAPRFWPIRRKQLLWTIKPNPGPHPISRCITLTLIVRETLKLAKTRKEAKILISQEKIRVDGARPDEKLPVGLMDVVSIPELKKVYRVIPSSKGLILHPVGKEEADYKLCRIEGKRVTKGGNTQLNLHDGRNIFISVEDPKNPIEDVYQTLDTLKISLPSQEVIDSMKLTNGAIAIIIGGKNVGRHGKIVSIEEKEGKRRRNLVTTIEDVDGEHFQTILDYVFVVGDVDPSISLPKVS